MFCRPQILIVLTALCFSSSVYSGEPARPRLLRHPYLQKGSGHSMGVAWMIDDELSCSVEYGTTRRLGQVAKSSPHQRMHFVEIKGLKPDTRYYYRLRCGKYWLTPNEKSYYFRTHATDPNRPFSFVVLGDSGQPTTGDQCPVADLLAALRPKPDFIIHTGDLSQRWAVDEGEFDLLVFGVYGDMLRNTPFYPTQGNHDWVTDWEHGLDPLYPRFFQPGKNDSRLTERYDMPFWRVFHSPRNNRQGDVAPFSFRYGGAMFVCEAGSGKSTGRSMAEKRFTEPGLKWRFFYSHYFGMAGRAVPGADLRWDPPLPKCDITFRGHVHVYSRSAAYGPHQQVDMLVGCSGATIGRSYFESMVTQQNPHGLRPGLTDWNEKCPHLVHVLVTGNKLKMKSYYPDGLVFDSLTIDKTGGKKRVVGMPKEKHPLHPAWQRGMTRLMRKLWVDENPKWRSLGSGLWKYVGKDKLQRLGRPIQRRSRYVEPRFVLPRRDNKRVPTNIQEANWAIKQLMDVHYRLGRHEWDKTTFPYFEARFRRYFGAGDRSLPLLVAMIRDTARPIKHRLGSLGGLGILAEHSAKARQQLVEFSNQKEFNIVFSSCIIRSCWLGDQKGLDALFGWMKREMVRQPPNPQFRVNTPGHYGNPIYVLRKFSLPALFSLKSPEERKDMLSIPAWVAFYQKNKHRLRYVRSAKRYALK